MRGLWICFMCVGLLACSSSKETESGAAGAAAPSGNTSAGTPGATGTTGSPGRTGNQSSTATASGGAPNEGGGSCPAELPAETLTCSPVGMTCDYPGRQCECESEGFVAVWNCRRARLICPDALPESGSACTPGRGECMFDSSVCVCPEESSAWSCWNPADCPPVAPAELAACDFVGMECPYEDTLEELDCECTNEGWDCGRQACPADVPAIGGPCEGGDGVCTFDAQTCDCRKRAWVCWDPSTCPATPSHDAACSVEGMICAYSGGECECEDAAWSCDSELRQPNADADAGM